MRRRPFLAALGIGAASVAGCLQPTDGTEPPPDRERSSPTPASTPKTPAFPTYPDRPNVRLGEASVDLAPRGTDDFSSETAQLRCACVAADAVRDHVYARLDDRTGVSVGCGRATVMATPAEDTGFSVTVHHTVTFGRDGERTSTPAVSYGALVGMTPRTVSATVVSGEREHECTVPVYVVHAEAHVD